MRNIESLDKFIVEGIMMKLNVIEFIRDTGACRSNTHSANRRNSRPTTTFLSHQRVDPATS